MGALPLEKYPFKIKLNLPFMTFPVGNVATNKDMVTLIGLVDTGAWATYSITKKTPIVPTPGGGIHQTGC
jgi:hypothetical protein